MCISLVINTLQYDARCTQRQTISYVLPTSDVIQLSAMFCEHFVPDYVLNEFPLRCAAKCHLKFLINWGIIFWNLNLFYWSLLCESRWRISSNSLWSLVFLFSQILCNLSKSTVFYLCLPSFLGSGLAFLTTSVVLAWSTS